MTSIPRPGQFIKNATPLFLTCRAKPSKTLLQLSLRDWRMKRHVRFIPEALAEQDDERS